MSREENGHLLWEESGALLQQVAASNHHGVSVVSGVVAPLNLEQVCSAQQGAGWPHAEDSCLAATRCYRLYGFISISSIYLNPELQLPMQAHKYANYCLRSTALLISPGLVALPAATGTLRPHRVLQWASLRGSLLLHGPSHPLLHGSYHPKPPRLLVVSGFAFFVCYLSLWSHWHLLPLKRGEENEMEQCLSRKGKGWKNLQLAQLLDTSMLKGMSLTHAFSWLKVVNVKQKMMPVLHRHGTGFFLLCLEAVIVKKSFMWIGVRDVIWCCKTGGSGSYPQTFASDRTVLLSVTVKIYDRKELAVLGWQPGENFLL